MDMRKTGFMRASYCLFLKINKKYCGLDIRFFDFNYGRELVKSMSKVQLKYLTDLSL